MHMLGLKKPVTEFVGENSVMVVGGMLSAEILTMYFRKTLDFVMAKRGTKESIRKRRGWE